MRTTIKLLILTWHQDYISANAGGYVRMKEFLKRVPKNMDFLVLDNKPTIFSNIIPKKYIVEYTTPNFIKRLQKNVFIFWFLLETVGSFFALYSASSRLIKQYNVRVVYFPIGEFLQLYLLFLALKLRFPQVRIVIDILNYGILDKNYLTYFKRLLNSGLGMVRAVITTVIIFSTYSLMRLTIKHADFVFTVSKDFVKKIKKDYKKETIDFTPSGVTRTNVLHVKKKYLGIYIGRMTVEKGVFDVLIAWNTVITTLPNAQLMLAGSADLEMRNRIHKTIEKNKLKENVTVLFDISEQQKKQLLSESELFLHLAHYEPLFPVISILEGCSFGLPVILYNMTVLQNTMHDMQLPDGALFICQRGDVEASAKKIIEFSAFTSEKKRKLSDLASRLADRFNWDAIAKKEFDVIKKLIKI